MPMIDDGSGNLVQQILALSQLNAARNQQQGANQISTALPGQTVGDVGMSEKQFHAMFGKDTPYNPSRVLKDQKASDLVDDNTKAFLRSLSVPDALNMSATLLANQMGTPGATTASGLRARLQAGGRADEVANTVSEATKPEAVATGISKAKTQATQAQSAEYSAVTVADAIKKGIEAYNVADDKTKAAFGQQAAFGTTMSGVQANEQKNALASASLKEALDAQTNPNAPIHKFLRSQGLDLHTVLAGSAMGINNLFDNYSRFLMTSRTQDKEAANIMLRMQADAAKDISEKTFAGKVTPRQVMAIMAAREEGRALPKSLEAAAEVYDRGVDIAYQGAMQQAITKGDPMMQAFQTQIDLLMKSGGDVHSMVAVRDLTSRMGAYSLTMQQVGSPPSDPDGRARWDRVYQKNLQNIPKAGIHAPLMSTVGSMSPSGIGTNLPMPDRAPVPIANPAAAPAANKSPTSVLPSLLPMSPGGQPAPQVADPLAGMSPEQKAAVQGFLSTLQPKQP